MEAMRFQVAYLRRNGKSVETPISSIKRDDKWQQIRGDDITAPSELSSAHQAGPLDLQRPTLAHTPSVQGGLWIYAWRRWNHTPSAWWGGWPLHDGKELPGRSSAKKIVWHLRAHPSHAFRKLVPSGTQSPLIQRVYGGLVQDQCGIGK